MAINFTDFSKIPTQKPADLVGDFFRGYQMGTMPKKLADEAKERELSNRLKQLEAEHKPKEFALSDEAKTTANALSSKALQTYDERFNLEKQLKQAQIKKANSPSQLKPSGDVLNAMYINELERQLGANDQRVIDAKEAHQTNINAKKVNTETKAKYGASLNYRNLPSDEKKRAVALTTGMGLDPIEGEKFLSEGKTLKEIAEQQGVNVDDVIPVYPVGSENIKQTQRRGGFVKELKYLDEKVAEPMAEYSTKFHGYSLSQIADAISNENPEKQGKILASRALAPEIAALRLKVAGGNIGIEAIRELQDKSLSNLNVIESTVSPDAYRAMQKYMNLWLGEAAQKYEDAINDYGRLKTNSSSNQTSGKVFNLATGAYE